MSGAPEDAIEKPCADTITLRWEVDALKHWRREIDTKVRLVIDKAMKVLHMRSVRGPDPDAPYQPETDRDLVRLAAREAARAAVEIGTYNEGGGDNDKKGNASWQNWILGIVGGMISLGVGALLLQVSDLKAQAAAIAAKQDTSLAATNQRLEANERRIENLERRVFQ